MQYFAALKIGKKRVDIAREYLNALTGDRAVSALALRNTKTLSSWEPVGTEMYYAFVSDAPGFVLEDSNGYVLALVDSTGASKAIVQNVTPEEKKILESTFDDDGVREFGGDVILPV